MWQPTTRDLQVAFFETPEARSRWFCQRLLCFCILYCANKKITEYFTEYFFYIFTNILTEIYYERDHWKYERPFVTKEFQMTAVKKDAKFWIRYVKGVVKKGI